MFNIIFPRKNSILSYPPSPNYFGVSWGTIRNTRNSFQAEASIKNYLSLQIQKFSLCQSSFSVSYTLKTAESTLIREGQQPQPLLSTL